MAVKSRPTAPRLAAIMPEDQAGGANKTVADFVVEQIRAGVDPATAAGTVGVTPGEFTAWMREGILVRSRLDSGSVWETDFTTEQQDCCVFSDAVVRAVSTHLSRLQIISEQIARGGVERRITRTKTVNGAVTEVHETLEKSLPDGDMIKWKLEKLAPAVYGPKATLNVNVADMTDTDAVADVVARRMGEIAAGLRARAIEAAARDTPPGP